MTGRHHYHHLLLPSSSGGRTCDSIVFRAWTDERAAVAIAVILGIGLAGSTDSFINNGDLLGVGFVSTSLRLIECR